MTILFVVGARPNFMKVAPVMREMDKYPDKFDTILVHTGQHYSDNMSQVFFDELGLPTPYMNLAVGTYSDIGRIAHIMTEFETVCAQKRPDLVVVAGDVDSTFACAYTASRLNIPVAHIEAGLRSFDRSMPEEINRIIVDHISDLLFVSEQSGLDNLKREGIDSKRVHFVGNTMVDTLLQHKEQAQKSKIREELGLDRYGVITLHRPSNVDNPETFKKIMEALEEVAKEIPLVFPVHPRIRTVMMSTNIFPIPPLGYLDFLCLMSNAKLVLTDSGGIQEETTALGIPCLTLRNNTERPVTVSEGTNTLVKDPEEIKTLSSLALNQPYPRLQMPTLWDGHASERIVDEILNHYALS